MRKNGLLIGAAAIVLLAGCRGNSKPEGASGYRNDVPAQTLAEAAAEELGEDYWADMELAPEYLDDWYGISDDMYEEYYGQTPMISANVDSLIVVKAKDDRIVDVENAFNTYHEAMVQDTLQYPSNLPKLQASEIRTFGNYVCFVQLGADAPDKEGNEEEAVKVCQEMNERALAAIEKELKK